MQHLLYTISAAAVDSNTDALLVTCLQSAHDSGLLSFSFYLPFGIHLVRGFNIVSTAQHPPPTTALVISKQRRAPPLSPSWTPSIKSVFASFIENSTSQPEGATVALASFAERSEKYLLVCQQVMGKDRASKVTLPDQSALSKAADPSPRETEARIVQISVMSVLLRFSKGFITAPLGGDRLVPLLSIVPPYSDPSFADSKGGKAEPQEPRKLDVLIPSKN